MSWTTNDSRVAMRAADSYHLKRVAAWMRYYCWECRFTSNTASCDTFFFISAKLLNPIDLIIRCLSISARHSFRSVFGSHETQTESFDNDNWAFIKYGGRRNMHLILTINCFRKSNCFFLSLVIAMAIAIVERLTVFVFTHHPCAARRAHTHTHSSSSSKHLHTTSTPCSKR